jgi:hypothetical protein
LQLRCLACRSIRRSRCRRGLPLWRVSAANWLGIRRCCLFQTGTCSRRRTVQNLCPRRTGGAKGQDAFLPDMRNDGVLGGRYEARPLSGSQSVLFMTPTSHGLLCRPGRNRSTVGSFSLVISRICSTGGQLTRQRFWQAGDRRDQLSTSRQKEAGGEPRCSRTS